MDYHEWRAAWSQQVGYGADGRNAVECFWAALEALQRGDLEAISGGQRKPREHWYDIPSDQRGAWQVFMTAPRFERDQVLRWFDGATDARLECAAADPVAEAIVAPAKSAGVVLPAATPAVRRHMWMVRLGERLGRMENIVLEALNFEFPVGSFQRGPWCATIGSSPTRKHVMRRVSA
jgi:hypothetical protein